MPSAEALLRLALAWASGLSLRQVCALAAANGVARLADASLVERFGGETAEWLADIAGALLAARLPATAPVGGRRLVLVDGTAICQPGAERTSWRLHIAYDPARRRLDAVTLTDGRGAERLSRFHWVEGDIGMADRYYARPGEVRLMRQAGADLLVRTGWNSLRLLTPAGGPFDLMAALARAGEAPGEYAVRVDDRHPDPPPLRLILARLPQEKAEQARRRLRQDAKKRGRTPDARSLLAAGFVLLLTSLPADAFPPARVCALYRLRWQIELAIKRLKSLLGLGALPAKSPALARVWLYAKLILALLLPRPRPIACGAPFPPLPGRTLSFWRLLRGVVLGLLVAILAPPPPEMWPQHARDLARHLTDPPRRRPCQAEDPNIMLS